MVPRSIPPFMLGNVVFKKSHNSTGRMHNDNVKLQLPYSTVKATGGKTDLSVFRRHQIRAFSASGSPNFIII